MSEIRQLLNDELLKVEPPAVVQQAPSPPMPAEDRQAVDQAFSHQKDEDEESMAAMLLAWQMMPLVQERHLKKTAEDEEEDEEEQHRLKPKE